MSESNYFKTYTSFSGADIITVLNKTVIGEITSVQYVENLNPSPSEHPITGTIEAVVFDRSVIRQSMSKDFFNRDEFILFMKNEYGQYLSVRFEDFRFIERKGGFEVDDVILSETYTFSCSEIVFDQTTPFGQSKVSGEFGYLFPEEDKAV